jgi:eukaryotic translation initiation factor 2C
MIRFAVTRPKERLESIRHGVGMLKWHEDPYLKHFGLQIDPNMTKVSQPPASERSLLTPSQTAARVLPNPEVQFAGAKLNPGTSGRWDLRGKKLLLPNTEPLKSWGVVIIGGCTNDQTVRNFMNVFIQTYVGHGGKVENKNPVICTQNRGEEIGDAVARARTEVGNQAKALPQIMFFVLPGRDSFMYERLKKNMECRFAMVSQSKFHISKKKFDISDSG